MLKIHRLALIKLCKRTMSSVKMVGCHANTTRVVIKVVHSFKHREELVRGSLGVLWAVGVLRRRRISSCTPKIDHASIESGCRQQIICGFLGIASHFHRKRQEGTATEPLVRAGSRALAAS